MYISENNFRQDQFLSTLLVIYVNNNVNNNPHQQNQLYNSKQRWHCPQQACHVNFYGWVGKSRANYGRNFFENWIGLIQARQTNVRKKVLIQVSKTTKFSLKSNRNIVTPVCPIGPIGNWTNVWNLPDIGPIGPMGDWTNVRTPDAVVNVMLRQVGKVGSLQHLQAQGVSDKAFFNGKIEDNFAIWKRLRCKFTFADRIFNVSEFENSRFGRISSHVFQILNQLFQTHIRKCEIVQFIVISDSNRKMILCSVQLFQTHIGNVRLCSLWLFRLAQENVRLCS